MSIAAHVDFSRCSVRAAGLQIQGARQEQEDAFLLLPQDNLIHPRGHFLALVADGMGGMGGGRVAAQTAAKAYADAWLAPQGTTLTAALDAANAALTAGKNTGMVLDTAGTTLVALEISDRGCQWLHVGDSYLLLFKNGKLSRLNTPLNMQWWRQEKEKRGLELTPEEATVDGQILYSALCGDELRAAESAEHADCSPGCRYIVASDGIAPLIENGTLQEMLSSPETAAASPEATAKCILQAEQELQLAKQDNATVIVIDILPPSAPQQDSPVENALLTYSQVSDIGDRDTQQDNEACWVSQTAALAVVADGAGSYSDSEMASALVVSSLKECWETALKLGVEAPAAGKIIAEGALKAHRLIHHRAGGNTHRCGKSAFVALYLHKGKYAVVHVGDCRAYYGKGKNMKPLTKDDSMLQRLLDCGKISPQEAKTSPEQGVLLQAIGGTQEPTPHISVGSYSSTGTFLLCCDGFWNQLPETLWDRFALTSPEMDRQHALEILVQSAVKNADGDSDNVSAVWLHPQVYMSPTAASLRKTVLSAAVATLAIGITALGWLTLSTTQDTDATSDTDGTSPTGETTETDGTSPTGETAETDGTSPTGETAETDGTSPTGETAETDGTSPTGETAETDGTSPTGETAETDGTSPTGETAETDGTSNDAEATEPAEQPVPSAPEAEKATTDSLP